MSFFQLSKESDYSLVMLSILSRHGSHAIVSRSRLQNLGLPKPFMAQIGKKLVSAGILGSKEGRKGGYFLKKKPSEITLNQVLKAVEGDLSPVTCIMHPGKCPAEKICSQKKFLLILTDEVKKILNKYTINDLK